MFSIITDDLLLLVRGGALEQGTNAVFTPRGGWGVCMFNTAVCVHLGG